MRTTKEAHPQYRQISIPLLQQFQQRRPGVFEPGPLDAITDVAGVAVGQVTLIEGERVRTGVTAVLPHAPHHAPDAQHGREGRAQGRFSALVRMTMPVPLSGKSAMMLV